MKRRCPVCKRVIAKAMLEASRKEKFYPFCSNRCKLIDLGKWLDSDYRIPAADEDKNSSSPDEENDKSKNH